ELLDLSRKLDVFYSRSHGIKNLSAIEDANDKSKALQQRLTVAELRVSDLEASEKKLWTTKTWPEEWRSNKDFEKFADRIVGHGPHGPDIYVWIDDIPPTYRVRCLQAFEGGFEIGKLALKPAEEGEGK
ncbi:MAG: hypothetical protein J6D44_07330, partial [Pseudomonas sp.]|nr:hypothetical protein [Pseudomonas sp.]